MQGRSGRGMGGRVTPLSVRTFRRESCPYALPFPRPPRFTRHSFTLSPINHPYPTVSHLVSFRLVTPSGPAFGRRDGMGDERRRYEVSERKERSDPASVTLVSSVCLSALLSVRSSFTSVSSGSFLTSRSERSTRQTKDDECDAETRDVGRLVWLLSSCPNLRATPRRSFVTSVSSLVVPPGESDRPSASRYACPTHPAGRIE